MKRLKASLAFAKNLLTTGAITQTSRNVEREIRSKIPNDKDVVIVEFGMGHGNITQAILDNVSANSSVYSFEVNEKFCEQVRGTIDDKRLSIINMGAEQLPNQVESPVDYFVSSIPLSIMSKDLVSQILNQSYEQLKDGGYFSQIQYAKNHRKKFEGFFDTVEITSFFNIPPENIYHCKKTRSKKTS